MQVVSYSNARAGLRQVMDGVCMNHEPAIITRQKGDHVVMLSLQDYNSLAETLYLMSSPKNARRLMRSIEQVRTGKAHVHALIDDGNDQTEQ